MGYSLDQTRKICADALRQCEQAERQAQQIRQAAAQQRQIALTEARQKYVQTRQQIETIINEIRRLADEGDRILSELGLAVIDPAPFALPPGASTDELVRLLQNQRGRAHEAMARLKDAAESLKKRRKWWKFR